jgi:hypothetical protein
MSVNDPTTNYAWNLPNVAGDSGNWGAMLREILGDDVTGIDTIIKAVSTVANAALPKAGGTMTGDLKQLRETFAPVDLGNISGLVTVNLALGNHFYATLVGNVTFAFTNPPATGTAFSFMLELTQDATGSRVITWPGSVKLTNASLSATTTATNVYLWILYTRTGGTKYRGAMVAETGA